MNDFDKNEILSKFHCIKIPSTIKENWFVYFWRYPFKETKLKWIKKNQKEEKNKLNLNKSQ